MSVTCIDSMGIIKKRNIDDMINDYTNKILNIIYNYNVKIAELKEQIKEMERDHKQKVDELQDKIDDLSDV